MAGKNLVNNVLFARIYSLTVDTTTGYDTGVGP